MWVGVLSDTSARWQGDGYAKLLGVVVVVVLKGMVAMLAMRLLR